MKAFTIVAFIFLSLIRAHLSAAADNIPPCGLLCIEELTLKSTCSLTNTTCICTNAELNANILECVSANCTIREQLTTEKYSKDSCGVKPRDRTRKVAVIGLTFGALALIAYGLRIMSRINGSGGSFGMDDYVMTLAMCILIPLCSLSLVLANHGLGRDIWNVSFDDIQTISYLFFWDELLYLSALPLTKISILFFYLRIFPAKNFRYFTFALMGLNIGYLITFECVSIWQCKPLNAAWRRWDGTYPSHCNNINLQSWMSAALNIALDLCILALPMPELYKLSMSRKKKFHIMCMFSVGIFVTIVSCFRLNTLITFGSTTNMTQDYVDLGVWSTIEVPVGVICACMPSIRSLFRHVFPSLLSQTKKDSESAGSSMPKYEKKSRERRLSSKPQHGDDGSFVQLVEMDSRFEGKV